MKKQPMTKKIEAKRFKQKNSNRQNWTTRHFNMIEKWNYFQTKLQRKRQNMKRRMKKFAYIVDFSRKRDWISPKMMKIKNAIKWFRKKNQKNMSRAKIQARQKSAEQLNNKKKSQTFCSHDQTGLWRNNSFVNRETIDFKSDGFFAAECSSQTEVFH